MEKVYKTKDCDLKYLSNKVISVIGYGIQGRAQALNLRDSGCDVIIGNVEDKYKIQAKKDGFKVFSIEEAIQNSNITLLLIPDESHKHVFEKYVNGKIKDNHFFAIAHGYSIKYNKFQLPKNADVCMLAPRAPGEPIRNNFLNKKGIPAFIDVIQDFSGKALNILLALGKAIGYSNSGMISISYEEETELDLYIEHFIGPLFIGAVEKSLEFLIKSGYSPMASALELWMSGERGFMWSIYARDGLYKALNNNASPTCKYGISSYMGETFNEELSNQMQKVINSIKDGSFAKNLDKEEEKNYKQVKEFFNKKNNSLISKVEKETKNILGEYL